MADPLATPANIATYWRPLTDAETSVATALILVASAMIRRRLPTVDLDIAAGRLDESIVQYVITEMVKGGIESGSRPVDAKSVSETVGPYQRSVSYAVAVSALAFTDDLFTLLGGVSAVEVGSARLSLPACPVVPPVTYQASWPCWR